MSDPTSAAFQRAREHIGQTPNNRVRWLLDFYQRDISELSPTEREQIALEWVVFLGESPSQNFILPSRDQLTTWQQRIRDGIGRLAEGQTWCHKARANLELRVEDGKVGSKLTLQKKGNAFRPAEFKAMEALLGIPLRFCANEKCHRPFIRSRRMRYCSPRCRGTVNTRKYRQHHP